MNVYDYEVKNYTKRQVQPMFPWDETVDMFCVSVSEADSENGSPKQGDMIAFNPNNMVDKWLVAEKFYKDNYQEVM